VDLSSQTTRTSGLPSPFAWGRSNSWVLCFFTGIDNVPTILPVTPPSRSDRRLGALGGATIVVIDHPGGSALAPLSRPLHTPHGAEVLASSDRKRFAHSKDEHGGETIVMSHNPRPFSFQ